MFNEARWGKQGQNEIGACLLPIKWVIYHNMYPAQSRLITVCCIQLRGSEPIEGVPLFVSPYRICMAISL